MLSARWNIVQRRAKLFILSAAASLIKVPRREWVARSIRSVNCVLAVRALGVSWVAAALIPDGLVVIAAVTNGNATSVVGRDSFSDGRAGGARRRDKTFIYFIWRRLTGSYAGSPGGGSTWVVSSSQLSFRCDLAPVINHCTMTLHGTTDRLAACASLFRIHFNRRRRPSQPAAASNRHVIVPQSAT